MPPRTPPSASLLSRHKEISVSLPGSALRPSPAVLSASHPDTFGHISVAPEQPRASASAPLASFLPPEFSQAPLSLPPAAFPAPARTPFSHSQRAAFANLDSRPN